MSAELVPVTHSNDPKIINLPSALARLGNDEDLLRDLARFYVEDAIQQLDELEFGLKTGDVELATRSAHNLKSLSSNFDANRAIVIAKDAEQKARQGQLEMVSTLLSELQHEVKRVVRALNDEVIREN